MQVLKKLVMGKPVKCNACNGTGFADDFKALTCPVCKGVGKVRI